MPGAVAGQLTARLWDVGSTAPYGHRGDLTTLTEAIRCHGGEGRAAVIEFLKTLQIVPAESAVVGEP